MKLRDYFLFSIFILPILLLAQSSTSYQNDRGDIHLLGNIDREDLNQKPYQTWFDSIYQDYKVDNQALKELDKRYRKDIQVKIFLGTWCGDSKREVSRFFKILDHSALKTAQVELVCLDNRREAYKQGPHGEEKGLNIHRVPTFIFYDNDQEIGRIVEYPVTSLEMEMAQIYAGIPAKPNYRLANQMGQLFKEKTAVEVDTFLNQHLQALNRLVSSEYELTTYGFVLLAADKLEKAKIVFDFNTKLFPESGYAMYGLGRAFMANQEITQATECFFKAMELGGENGYSKRRIKELIAVRENE